MQRTLSLAMGDRHPTIARPQERTPTRQYTHVRHHLRELVEALEHADDAPQAGSALRVRLFDREDEERTRERGQGLGF